jgi:Uma2 family endonuclease
MVSYRGERIFSTQHRDRIVSIAALPPWNVDQPPPVPVRRFSVDEYHRIEEIGVLTEDDRVELLEGWIVPKMVHNPPHDGTIQMIAAAIRACLPEEWCDRIQSSITTQDSEPEPDLAIVRGSVRSFLLRHPGPDEVGLIIEVANSTLNRDRTTKARLYGRAGIPVYWIVNLIDRQLELFTEPTGPDSSPGYRQQRIFGPDDEIPFELDGSEIARFAVRDFLP